MLQLAFGTPAGALKNRDYWREEFTRQELKNSRRLLSPVLTEYLQLQRGNKRLFDEARFEALASSIAANGRDALPAALYLAGITKLRLDGPWNSHAPIPLIHRDQPFREHAAKIISKIRDSAAIPILLRIRGPIVWEGDEGRTVSEAALRALVGMRTPMSSEELQSLITSSRPMLHGHLWRELVDIIQLLPQDQRRDLYSLFWKRYESDLSLTFSLHDKHVQDKIRELPELLSENCITHADRLFREKIREGRWHSDMLKREHAEGLRDWFNEEGKNRFDELEKALDQSLASYDLALASLAKCPKELDRSSSGPALPGTLTAESKIRRWRFNWYVYLAPDVRKSLFFDDQVITDIDGKKWWLVEHDPHNDQHAKTIDVVWEARPERPNPAVRVLTVSKNGNHFIESILATPSE